MFCTAQFSLISLDLSSQLRHLSIVKSHFRIDITYILNHGAGECNVLLPQEATELSFSSQLKS